MSGTYIGIYFEDDVNNYIKNNTDKDFYFNKFDDQEYHITVIYDEVKNCEYKGIEKINGFFKCLDYKILKGQKGNNEKLYLVLTIESPFIKELFREYIKKGFRHSYNKPIFHITLGVLEKEIELPECSFKNKILNFGYLKTEEIKKFNI